MKAVLISKSDCQVVDRDIPSPGPGEILVKSAFNNLVLQQLSGWLSACRWAHCSPRSR